MTGRALRRGNWSVQELERLRHLLPRRGVQGTAELLRRTADSVRRRAASLYRGPMRRAAWTADDELQLRRSWGAVEPRLLAVMLCRPMAEVLRRASALRAELRTGAWSRTELRMLKELYGTRSDLDLEVCLRRPAAEIAATAERLCLQKDKRFAKGRRRSAAAGRMPRWTQAQTARLVELYPDHDNLEVARALGRTVASVANKAWQLGLRKSPALLQQIGRTNVAARYESGSGAE
ncbi:MAG: hypothetical protein AB7O97_16760 [Planctomycetota bacterium]